jgi:hypothetical protein
MTKTIAKQIKIFKTIMLITYVRPRIFISRLITEQFYG